MTKDKLPFTQKKSSYNSFVRRFDKNIDPKLLTWHRDKEDRIVEAVENTNWLFQMDNQLPIKIEGEIFIPKNTFHRIIKGDGDLKVKVQKL
jgi:uncharacterized heparinase superfamily protein